MTVSKNHIYLTWGGVFGTSNEIWQCGVRFYSFNNSEPTQVPSNSALANWANGQLSNFHSSSDLGAHPACRLTWAKAALIGTDYKYASDAQVFEMGTPVNGGGSAANGAAVPTQVALCVSLWSGSTLGKTNHGRFYSPCNTLPHTGSSFTLASIDATAVANKADAMLTGAQQMLSNSTGGGSLLLAIMPSSPTGTPKDVEYIRVGHVKDTQRRRRNRLQEAYSQILYSGMV